MLITREFTFDSAHKLERYSGKCGNLHGHTYKLQVTVKGEINNSGMVIDFIKLKEIVNKLVIDKIDHTYLNEIVKQPTAENLVIWIWNQLKEKLPLYKLKLWETPDCFVTYMGEQ